MLRLRWPAFSNSDSDIRGIGSAVRSIGAMESFGLPRDHGRNKYSIAKPASMLPKPKKRI